MLFVRVDDVVLWLVGDPVPVWIVDVETFTVESKLLDAEEYVAAVAFSPDDTKLATGSWDQRVYVYDAEAGYRLLWTLTGNSSSVEHVMWSADSEVLMSNSKDCQMLYWEVASGARINKTSMLRDVQWAQWKAVLGWPVMGIWDPGYDQTDVNAVCQSHKGDVMALGDDYGQVKLFQFPSPTINTAGCAAYKGHSAHVTNVRWLHDDSRVMTTGGADTGVFQWVFHRDVAPEAAHTILAQAKGGNVTQVKHEEVRGYGWCTGRVPGAGYVF